MAKKKSSKKQPAQAADAVRSAVDQAFQAGQAQFSRERASELVDDLSQVAGRLREALDDLRPIGPEEIKALTDKVDALEARVAKLEKPSGARRSPAKRTTAAAKRTTTRSTAAKKPATKKPAARKSAARKPASKAS